ncbi:DUF6636 domain-containing protein [Rhodobacter ferrooxidans]|uniref:Uncharacterized protein n=1 Tax=Rhodobacter ferrooxidans TaxID=371731 RepID=C8RY42_9RHOB|nr:DUF6636 domain-containing protein [Rhodobacter sp. SW2]EEW26440.1 conserved hypothetical protein [Rhodobacter sp. SW2]
MDLRLAVVLLLTASPALADEFLAFRAPSGNIHCMIATGDDYAQARCDMVELTPSFTKPPAGCDLDWGSAFSVGLNDSQGQLACVGDTVMMPDAAVLGYGNTLTSGGFSCTSDQTGMTCTNPAGHGFSLSKARQRLF